MDSDDLLTQISELQMRASTALTQVNRREIVDLTGFDEQTKTLCALAQSQDYTEESKTTIMRALGDLIRTMDDIEIEMERLINAGKQGSRI